MLAAVGIPKCPQLYFWGTGYGNTTEQKMLYFVSFPQFLDRIIPSDSSSTLGLLRHISVDIVSLSQYS